jgi:undecaprenyl-diphosphatase
MKQPQRVSNTAPVAPLGASILGAGRWLVRELPRCFVAAVRNRRTAIALVTIAMVAFTSLAVFAATSEATLLRFDRAVQGLLLDSRTEWLNHAMIWLTFLGTRYVIAVAALGLLIWSRVNKNHQTFVMIIVAAAILNPVLEVGFKELVDRVRPAIDQLLPGNGPSFPSGHVLAAVGFYGLFPFLTWEATHKTWLRFAAFLGSLAVVVVVTVSRPYLDVHWATDAIAGALLGMVLVVASYQVYLRIAEGEQASAA